MISTANDLDSFYRRLRPDGELQLLIGWVVCLLLLVGISMFKRAVVPNASMPSSESEFHRIAVWFVMGIDGLASALGVLVSAGVFSGVLVVLNILVSEDDFITSFLIMMVPTMLGLSFLYEVLWLRIAHLSLQKSQFSSFGPLILNQGVFIFYSGVFLFATLYLLELETRYQRRLK